MTKPKALPAQQQEHQPGIEARMRPKPEFIRANYRGSQRLDVLVNNAAAQWPQDNVEDIDLELERTFRTNIFSYSCLRRQRCCTCAPAARSSILAGSLVERGIRVNGVAPGPIWTPLLPASFAPDKVQSFGKDTSMERAGQPSEVAPCYVLLCCDDASYMTGHTLHPNGGSFVAT